MLGRMVAITVIFFGTTIAWFILGGTIFRRTYGSEASDLRSKVGSSWGTDQRQRPPSGSYLVRSLNTKGEEQAEFRKRTPAQSRIEAKIDLEHRRKGLLWYSTYVVDFNGRYLFR